ncbi:MAG: ABC transporter substrate-binding protein [Acidimicrobiales bacterium]
MRRTRIGVAGAIVAALALLASACADSGDDTNTGDDASGGGPGTCVEMGAEGELTVGSTDVSEQTLVAEIYIQCLEAAGVDVDTRLNIGSREIVLPALEAGDIDLYPEYVGTALTILGGDPTPDLDETMEALRPLFAEKGVTVLEPSPAENKNGFAVTQETADEHDLEKLSDLAGVAGELSFGAEPECSERPLCLPGLKDTYGLEFAKVEHLDSGGPLTKDALENGSIDVGLVFTSDGAVAARGFVVLEDDKDLQPVENLVPVIRDDAVNPDIEALLNAISAALTTEELSELNKLVDVDEEDPADAATVWLEENGFI